MGWRYYGLVVFSGLKRERDGHCPDARRPKAVLEAPAEGLTRNLVCEGLGYDDLYLEDPAWGSSLVRCGGRRSGVGVLPRRVGPPGQLPRGR